MLRIRPLAAVLLAASITVVVGCSSDDADTDTTATPTATEAMATATATTDGAVTATETPMAMDHAETGSDGILVALSLADAVGFHEIDETLNGDSPAIEASWLGATNNARTAVAALTWPADLADHAAEFVAAAGDLATALEADDPEAAASLATAAHEAQHHLTDMAYDYLAAHPDSATMSQPHAAGMLSALSVIDGVGFHGIDEALNDGEPVDPEWLGSTQHAATAVSAVIWPADLSEAADTFISAANDLASALEADDAEAAAPLATAAHEAQHELSHGGYEAVEAMSGSTDGMAMGEDQADTAGILVSLMLAGRVGFHAIDEALNGDSPAIEASWLGAVNNARIAAAATHWPADLEAGAMAYVTAASDLATALEADDPEAAAPLAAAAHEAQHELGGAGYAYLGSMAGMGDSMAMDGHDHTHSGETVEAPEGLTLNADIEAQPGAIHVVVDAPGLTIVTPSADTPHVDGEGHIHVTVDGVEVGMFFENDIVVTSVPAGMHEVVVGLSTNTHEAYARDGEPIEVTATVEVPAS
ncbi:MAG: hypothetical protein R3C39_13830 [Dehalococcoidia bacterium]